ncbi:hypothetical protein ABZZ16_07050, partial [Streptomyces sp. NPDC006386]
PPSSSPCRPGSATGRSGSNAVATVLVGTWTKEIDQERVGQVLGGRLPFDEATFVTDAPENDADDPGPRTRLTASAPAK